MALVMEDSDLRCVLNQYTSFSLIQTPNSVHVDFDHIKSEAMSQCKVTSDAIKDTILVQLCRKV
jgi:hypothetical protein